MLHATEFTEFPWGCVGDVRSAAQCRAVYPMNEAMKTTRGFQQSIHHTRWTCRPTAVKSAAAHRSKQFRLSTSFMNVHHRAIDGLIDSLSGPRRRTGIVSQNSFRSFIANVGSSAVRTCPMYVYKHLELFDTWSFCVYSLCRGSPSCWKQYPDMAFLPPGLLCLSVFTEQT